MAEVPTFCCKIITFKIYIYNISHLQNHINYAQLHPPCMLPNYLYHPISSAQKSTFDSFDLDAAAAAAPPHRSAVTPGWPNLKHCRGVQLIPPHFIHRRSQPTISVNFAHAGLGRNKSNRRKCNVFRNYLQSIYGDRKVPPHMG